MSAGYVLLLEGFENKATLHDQHGKIGKPHR